MVFAHYGICRQIVAGIGNRLISANAMKEMQRNWIGKSQGAEITFKVKSEQSDR